MRRLHGDSHHSQADTDDQAAGPAHLLLHLEVFATDIRYAARVVRRSGPLSLAVILTLTVGLGMNAVMFSLLNGLLFRSAARDPNTFVQVYAEPTGLSHREEHGPATMVTLEDFKAIQSTTRALSAVTVSRWVSFTLGDTDGTSLRGKFVSCNFLSAHLGPVRLGRGLADEDCSAPGLEPVVVLTEQAWDRYFAKDPRILGRALRINGRLLTVIGVAPDDTVDGPVAAMLYVPYTMQAILQGPSDYFRDPPDRHAWLNLSGRLAPGHTLGQAQAELTLIAKSLERSHPGHATDFLVTDGAIIHQPGAARTGPGLVVLCLGTTMLILLLVCGNVATLLLARAVTRRREMAIRLSIGGSRARLRRQLLTETIGLASAAAVGSIALAYYAPRVVAQWLSAFPLVDKFTPDWRVFSFTIGLALVAGCIAGVVPAVESLRVDLVTALNSATGGDSHVGARTRGALVTNQLSISLALLIVIGVIARAQTRLVSAPLEYDATRTVVTDVDLSHYGYTGASARDFYDRLIPVLHALPSVRRVALVSPPPFHALPRTSFSLETAADRTLVAPFRCVTPDYFSITGLHVMAGQLFSDAQARTPAQVIPLVVSQSFARTHFAGVAAVGARIRFANDDPGQIVAVVNDTSSTTPSEPDEPMIYQPIYSADVASIATILHVDGDARAVVPLIRARVNALDPRLSARPDTVTAMIAREAARYDAVLGATAIPAILALFLSVIGIYGVTAFIAAQRNHEIGVRVALGATRPQIVALFFQSMRWPFLMGLGAGSIAAMIGVALLKSSNILINGAAVDPLAYAGSIAVLVLTASVATLMPAVRATRSDPWSALRN
jgi:predicted permease